jgi:hypothetical protein
VGEFDNGFFKTDLIYNYFIEGREFDNEFKNMNLKVLKDKRWGSVT